MGRSHPSSDGRLHWGGVKEFADGSLGSRTALMWEPYSDDSSSFGTRLTPTDVLLRNAKGAAEAGLQVGLLHCLLPSQEAVLWQCSQALPCHSG
jgi:predicted amidohydrolase YtcJ